MSSPHNCIRSLRRNEQISKVLQIIFKSFQTPGLPPKNTNNPTENSCNYDIDNMPKIHTN